MDTAIPRSPSIRRATSRDAGFVISAFRQFLEQGYGGDHEAHAKRVIAAHLDGGVDRRGLLSTRQLLFVLWHGGRRRGVLNLVLKRQGTCKISPLIVDHAAGRQGFGGLLLATAESEAVAAGAHLIYCTVAEKKFETLRFFRRHGFAIGGRSHEQYKHGETEVVLWRSLRRPADESIISVTELVDDRHWPGVRKFLLADLNPRVHGADPDWLDALRSLAVTGIGHVYRACDRDGRLRAAAVAYRKKGDSLKVMPVAATDAEAFRALVLDLPSVLEGKGRKVILHICPTTEQVAVLQESGWQHEALLPGAYSRDQVTQQWGYSLTRGPSVRNLRIRRQYYDLIADGTKTLEIRVGYDNIRRIRAGDDIRLWAGPDSLPYHVTAVRRYDNFDQMLRCEDVDKALPGTRPEQALSQLRRIYPEGKEKLGVFVLELRPPAHD